LKVLDSYILPTKKYATCAAFHQDFFNKDIANQWGKALREKEIPVHYHPNKSDNFNHWDSDLQSIVERSRLNLETNKGSAQPMFVH